MQTRLSDGAEVQRVVRTWGLDTSAAGRRDGRKPAFVAKEVEVPQGVIRVETDMRVSVCDRWEYQNRVF